MEKIEISSIEDVKSFFQSLYDKHDLAFHPDDSFHDYVNEKGERLFEDEEAEVYDKVMEDCFTLCEREGVDIYEIGFEVQREEFRKRRFI